MSPAAITAAARGQTAAILAKSHKVKINWKKFQFERTCFNIILIKTMFLNSVRRIKRDNLFFSGLLAHLE